MSTGPQLPFDEAEIAAFFSKDVDTDNYYAIQMIPHQYSPARALQLTIDLLSIAPDDDGLCWVGVVVLEPLLELHWKALSEQFDGVLSATPSLRKAYSCVYLSQVPTAVWKRWRGLLTAEDGIGSQPAG